MGGGLFVYLFGIILATAGLLFGILAYNRKDPVFFWLGLSFDILVTIGLILNVEYYFYSLTQSADAFGLMTIGAWIISIVFLVLSKVNKKPNDDNVTDAFLDDIINAEDEEWDAES
jgi:uncharacterized membrane protein HdeD (DUF308 family)